MRYVSTLGGIAPVGFDDAVLEGFAADGGLFVPERIPKIPASTFNEWKGLPFADLACEVLPYFIDPAVVPAPDLARLVRDSFSGFSHPDVLPLIPSDWVQPDWVRPDPDDTGQTGTGGAGRFHIMELFHGPTLSFKDIAMGFLVRTMDYLLEKKGRHLNLILATTGDTGPAAAHAAAGLKTLDCWPLFPLGMISGEQQRQMTTLAAPNIHPVGVANCKDGGDDLDLVVADLFDDPGLKRELALSSVNSINWCRVMFQAVHYMYAYLKVCGRVGDPVIFSVPTGAFGNLFAGFLAREAGLPVHTFICANNQNRTLHRAFSTGVFEKRDLCRTLSSAIDIVVPYNFWRFLYFRCGQNPDTLSALMKTFSRTGRVRLDDRTAAAVQEGFASLAVSDDTTLGVMRETYRRSGYLLEPHGAVAVAAARHLAPQFEPGIPVVCLATAHPAKFPDVTARALGPDLPGAAFHPDLTRANSLPERMTTCNLDELKSVLIEGIRNRRADVLRRLI